MTLKRTTRNLLSGAKKQREYIKKHSATTSDVASVRKDIAHHVKRVRSRLRQGLFAKNTRRVPKNYLENVRRRYQRGHYAKIRMGTGHLE